MDQKRISVWVQKFKDREALMLQWLDPDTGKRKSRSAGTNDPDKAEQARADLEYELNHGKYRDVSRMTWETFRQLFEEEYLPGCRPETRKVYLNVFNLFEEVCNPTSLRSISERTLSAFVAGLRKRSGRLDKSGMAASSIKVRLQFLRTALNWAFEQNLLAKVPAFPLVKVPKKTPQPVPAESFERLLAKAKDQQTRVFLLCGWLAGLRRNEALALEWEESEAYPWVNFSRNRIVLPAGFVKAAADQWVPLDPQLREALESLPRQGRKVFHFRSKATGELLTPSGMSLLLTKLAREAGVKLSMKSLRRGFGCKYAGKVSAQVLQKLMRHANIKTTLDYYANVDDAVEVAVLGAQCNTLRNTPPPPTIQENCSDDATTYPGKTFD
jgi:integrase